MAFLYVSEFANCAEEEGNAIQVVAQPSLNDQQIGIPGTSAAFNANTRYVLLSADSVCSVKFGPAGTTAGATNLRVPANVPIYFAVPKGQNWIVANVANT